jgi:hypothetical protein
MAARALVDAVVVVVVVVAAGAETVVSWGTAIGAGNRGTARLIVPRNRALRLSVSENQLVVLRKVNRV